METRRPLVAEIKRNSLDDGPGIRSVVFFKGCPLTCVWCHNPECVSAKPEIMFRCEACIDSRECRAVCRDGAIGEAGPGAIDRDKCTLCGDCVDECPSGALSIIGKYYAPDELVATLARDKPFYDNSHGGVTLSGGEPTLILDYTADVARQLKQRGIHLLIETCGDFDWDRFAAKLLPYTDTVYADLKLASDALHKQHTGRGNARIKSNIERLIGHNSVEVLVRVPLVPGITTTRENLEAIAGWLREHNVARIALMPYNPLWIAKAKGLGKSLVYQRDTWMTEDERGAVKNIFAGFQIVRDF
jgi:pyruvate formate lyase activating enzyme